MMHCGLSGSSGEDYFNRGMIYMDLQDDTNASDMLNKSYDKGYKAALLGLGEIAMIRRRIMIQHLTEYTTLF